MTRRGRPRKKPSVPTPAGAPKKLPCAGLDEALEASLSDYFKTLDSQAETRLHSLVITKIERTLFSYVLKRNDYHLRKTAAMLGINRGTLSSRLKKYGISVPLEQRKRLKNP